MEPTESNFLCGVDPFSDLIFFAQQIRQTNFENESVSIFMFIDGTKEFKTFKLVSEIAPWICKGLASASSSEIIAMGSDGQFWEISPKTSLINKNQIENLEYELIGLSVISGSYYAVGMGRAVYKREGVGEWNNISPKDQVPKDKVIGFNDIDGFSANEIYAVGWAGEIWYYKDGNWNQIQLNTSNNFNAVCCAENGVVYVVGDNASFFIKKNSKWVEIETGVIGDFQDVRDFNGSIYLVSEHQMFQLNNESLLETNLILEPHFANVNSNSFNQLLKAKDGLVSMGQKDLWTLTKDNWNKLV